MIYDMAKQTWPGPWWQQQPTFTPNIQPWQPPSSQVQTTVPYQAPWSGPTKEQFQELIELLRAAKKFDTVTGQPDCEDKLKKEMLRKMAQAIGIDLPADL